MGSCAAIVSVFAQAPLASAGPLSIRVEGNHFVNGAGQTIRLLGVDRTTSEYGCVDGFGYNDGHYDAADAAAIASWNADAVRVPLNEDCWLGINGQPNSNEGAEPPLTVAGYRESIENYVADLNAHGLYAILDLHWTAPGSQVALEQQPMPDQDHSPAFWTSVASTFKNNPGVVFDLFNEPFDPTDLRSGTDQNSQDQVSWNCWDTGTENGPDGGAACDTSAYDENEQKTTLYAVAGMQTLLNAIRATGATQPVMVGGLNYANDLTQWATHAPDDPLNQEAASFHNYMGQECDDVGCWNSEIAPVSANVPVVTGEFDQDVAPCATSNFDDEYMEWADQHGVSYLAWGWVVLSPGEIEAEGCGAYQLIGDYNYTPAAPNGTNLRNHLLTLPAGGVTPATPSASGSPAKKREASIRLTTFHTRVEAGDAAIAIALRSAQSCKGSLSGQTTKLFFVSGSQKRRKVALGNIHFKLLADKTKSVVLKLSGPARRLLKANGSLVVRFTLILIGSSGGRTVLHRTVTLKKR